MTVRSRIVIRGCSATSAATSHTARPARLPTAASPERRHPPSNLEGVPFCTALFGDDVVDEAVLLGFFGAHEVVAVGVGFDSLFVLAAVFGQEGIELILDLEDML